MLFFVRPGLDVLLTLKRVNVLVSPLLKRNLQLFSPYALDAQVGEAVRIKQGSLLTLFPVFR